jgi:hypothetical protein
MFEATDLDDPLLDDDGNSIVEQRMVSRSVVANFAVSLSDKGQLIVDKLPHGAVTAPPNLCSKPLLTVWTKSFLVRALRMFQ